MTAVLLLMLTQALIGAFDTLYFHEYRARLPARGRQARAELRLHGVRAVIYAVLFGTLPWVAWHGLFAALLGLLLLVEIVITQADFVVEDEVRRPLGGVFPGERVTHSIMGIVYGAMLAHFVPVLLAWAAEPTALAIVPAGELSWLRLALGPLALGVLVSGLRDLAAASGSRLAAWPWRLVPDDEAANAETMP
ncbi:MAG: hypothetical protein R3B72_30480 [Polyangiaceae bacterium]